MLIEGSNGLEQEISEDTLVSRYEKEIVQKGLEGNIAVYDDGVKKTYTYSELLRESEILAKYLLQEEQGYNQEIQAGERSGKLIGVLSEKGYNQVVATLAIMKSGHAYLPLNVDWPANRLKEVLKEGDVSVVFISRAQFEQIEIREALSEKHHLIIIEDILDALQKDTAQKASLLEGMTLPVVAADDIAYVIFTSGSTGRPKGVTISHRGALNTIDAMNQRFKVTERDRILALAELSFDLSVYDIFGLLAVGGGIVFPAQDRAKDSQYWVQLINEYGVTLWNTVPLLASLLMDEIEGKGLTLSSMRLFLLSGDRIPLDLPKRIRKEFHDVVIMSLGGATEGSIWSIWYEIGEVKPEWNSIPYGTAMPNQKMYVLNEEGEHCPLGVIGEIHIGGIGVALNYWGDEEKTRTSFIEHQELGRLYKPGDLGRWHKDGYIEFIGRKDNQVKIRGHRVELGEIEAVLMRYPSIKQCVVVNKEPKKGIISKPSSEKNLLIAYYIRDLALNKVSEKDYVSKWKDIYQFEYSSLDIKNLKANLQGWNSSYTGEPIPKEDMLEWINNTIERIKTLNPNVILEIGSGSGLILFNIIDRCKYYYATDVSKNASDYTTHVINQLDLTSVASAYCCAAEDVPYDKFQTPYDTVVINSVVQHFPSVEYFESVTNKAISHIKNSGQVFIGDIRDYRLLNCFHYSVLKYKKGQATVEEVRYFSSRDKELLLSPQYFLSLISTNPNITHVDILPKLGNATHEMNNYRYDVVLHVNKKNSAKTLALHENDFTLSEDITCDWDLSKVTANYYCLKYPNQRVLKDYFCYTAECGKQENYDAEKFSNILTIAEISNKVHDGNYEVKFFLDIYDPLYLNIVLYRRDLYEEENIHIEYEATPNLDIKKMVTNPLVASHLVDNQFASDLRDYLKEHLPAYMVPDYFIPIDTIPLTVNGKLDIKSLPAIDRVQNKEIVLPRTDLEQQVCAIWANVLGLEKSYIGMKNNFFDIGGNSITMIRLKSMLEKGLKLDSLSMSDLFKYPSISEFVNYITGISKLDNLLSVNNINNVIRSEPIAIIGLAGSFSDSNTINEYWNNLIEGKKCLSRWSHEKSKKHGVPHNILNHKDYIPISGVVRDIDKFDPEFWGLPLNDAALMDPQIRKFLEITRVSLEGSGYINEVASKRVGVYAGASVSQYYESRVNSKFSLELNPTNWTAETMNGPDFLATRASYLLGLTGPSLNINTACSSSLVALIEGCNHLLMNHCDIALAGGVALAMPEYHGYIYQEGMILSRDGHCRPFDKNSSGTVGGAGVGVVVLKRLSDAIKDKDPIIAVIKGYAVNNDGHRKVGYTAPSVLGQTECILRAQKMAGVSADTISYVECHGTGTDLGDSIEIAALKDAFQANSVTAHYECMLGAVKANIGHAGSAAGIAGLIKVCKMLEHKEIPPQINFDSPNPNCHLEGTNFKITTHKEPWKTKDNMPRRAGVSAFGIGGTNAHVILEEYIPPTTDISEKVKMDYYVLPISAKSKVSYELNAKALAQHLEATTEIDMSKVTYTLQYKREPFIQRGAVVCKDRDDAIEQLTNIKTPIKSIVDNPDIIMMFPGQGMQYAHMGKQLYEKEAGFQRHIDECLRIIADQHHLNFESYLFPSTNPTSKEKDKLLETQWGQLGLFIVEYALGKLFESYQIEATAYIGHSIGEYVAATLSGVFTLEDALAVVIKRGELMQKMPTGSMLTVGASIDRIEQLLPDSLEIAVYNSPEYTVVSGRDVDIETFRKHLEAENIACIKLRTSHAFHSTFMTEAAQEFEMFLSTVSLNKPNKQFVSNLTGKLITDDQACSPHYWAQHIRQPVQFSQGVSFLREKYPDAVYLEMGPGNSLSTFVRQHKETMGTLPHTISILLSAKESQQQIDSMRYFYEAVGKLWSVGCTLDWSLLWGEKVDLLETVPLPTYQFEQKKCWIDLPIQDEQKSIMEPETTSEVIMESSTGYENRTVLTDEDTSETEEKIAKIFSQVLGNQQFSKHDSFFALGGTSLSAIRLVSCLNSAMLNLKVTISNIFQNETVHKIAKYLVLKSNFNSYQAIVELNNVSNKKQNLFLIHPGLSGCEVYRPLAKNLEETFSCYGIDSYNLYHENKITNMRELAMYYLSKIGEVMTKTHQHTYCFIGWSLGGLIALEIATILEEREKEATNVEIKVCLLDSVLDDDYLLSLKNNKRYIKQMKDEYNKYIMRTYNLDIFNARQAYSIIDVALILGKQGISAVLKSTQILLFKAMNKDPNVVGRYFNQLQDYSLALEFNNIEHVLQEPTRLKKVPLDDAHHNNILYYEKLLIDAINKFC